MTKRIGLAVALLFAASIAVDSFDSDCVLEADLACHACLCSTPTAPTTVIRAIRITPSARRYRTYQVPVFAGRLADKSLFRPPKAA